MPGGLMSLIATGAQDHYTHVSPEMSYFKQVYKRHTNFSMESIRQTFLTAPILDSGNQIASFKCRPGRVGDLIQQMYLYFELPNIYSDATTKFQWIPKMANYMINQCFINIDTQTIDQIWGEWMDIWNELVLPAEKRAGYYEMIGNISANTSPVNLFSGNKIVIKNNRFNGSYNVSSPTKPSIAKKSYYLPLEFWFTKNPALALPIIAIQYQVLEIVIEFRGIESLYQIYDNNTQQYVSPVNYRILNPTTAYKAGISYYTKYGGGGTSNIDLNAYIDCNYIFLDTAERTYIAMNPSEFLVDRVHQIQDSGFKPGYNNINLVLSNPVKELIWILRRSDSYLYNDWTNLTGTRPQDDSQSIINTAKIMWNGMDRFEDKPYQYFNQLQPYQHHTCIPRNGIHCYSFAIFPEKMQPSGTYNASIINQQQLAFTINSPNTIPGIYNEFNISVYSVYNNIFRVMGGRASMVFAI